MSNQTNDGPRPEPVSAALRGTLESPNESDANGEVANVVDGLFAIARALRAVAAAIERPEEGRE
jgi:hypothetical protein